MIKKLIKSALEVGLRGKRMQKRIVRLLSAAGFLQSFLWTSNLWAFFGKTELELNGIGVIKESAEILAHSIETFPTHSTAIAFIGLIIFSQGILLFSKGLVNMFSSSNDTRIRHRGRAQFIIGAVLMAAGIASTLHNTKISVLLMG